MTLASNDIVTVSPSVSCIKKGPRLRDRILVVWKRAFQAPVYRFLPTGMNFGEIPRKSKGLVMLSDAVEKSGEAASALSYKAIKRALSLGCGCSLWTQR